MTAVKRFICLFEYILIVIVIKVFIETPVEELIAL